MHVDSALRGVKDWASDHLGDAPEGEGLDGQSRALVKLAVCTSVASLDRSAVDCAIGEAFDSGVDVAQLQEILALVSGLGVHSLMVAASRLLEEAQSRGQLDAGLALDSERQALWDRFVRHDPYWDGFSKQLPGFLDALLRLSPDLFLGFMNYCALPWKSRAVAAVVKELAAIACDATPTHIFWPGLKLHTANAIKLGAGRRAILQAIDIGAGAPRTSYVE